MIRDGNELDIPDIIRMAKDFWKETIYDEEMEPEAVKDMALLSIEHGLMAILEIDNKVVGFACGIKGPLLATRKALAGTELAWWVDEDYRKGRDGLKLLQHLEQQAKNEGVKYWSMVYMESSMPEKIKKLYEILGYNMNEVTYTRVL